MIETDLDGRPVEPVRVSVGAGFKRNVGNYESMNINVSVSASARHGEDVDTLFERVYKYVDAKLLEKFDETESALREAGLGEKD